MIVFLSGSLRESKVTAWYLMLWLCISVGVHIYSYSVPPTHFVFCLITEGIKNKVRF